MLTIQVPNHSYSTLRWRPPVYIFSFLERVIRNYPKETTLLIAKSFSFFFFNYYFSPNYYPSNFFLSLFFFFLFCLPLKLTWVESVFGILDILFISFIQFFFLCCLFSLIFFPFLLYPQLNCNRSYYFFFNKIQTCLPLTKFIVSF